jgi:hypothetical protein
MVPEVSQATLGTDGSLVSATQRQSVSFNRNLRSWETNRMCLRLLLLALLTTIVCPRAIAFEVHCVGSEASLKAALDIAQTNGEDDYIYIQAGFYPLSAGLIFVSIEANNLILLGGYDPGCNAQTGFSTLHGGQMVRPLYVATDTGRLFVQGIHFQSGFTDGAGGGLYFNSTSGNATIRLNRFTSNRSLASAGALYARSGTGSVFVYSNVLHGNRANEVGGMILDQGADGRLVNNTILENVTDTSTVPGGVLLRGSGVFGVANNLIWNNTAPFGADFRADTSHSRHHNDIEFVANSVAPDSLSGELSVEPQLASCGLFCTGYDLAPNSPLIDAGSDAALDDLGPGLLDLRGNPRRLGPHVDIGAYEFDGRLFADGFEF